MNRSLFAFISSVIFFAAGAASGDTGRPKAALIRSCADLFALKAYEESAICFEKLAGYYNSSSLSIAEKYKKGMFLKNASSAWIKAAENTEKKTLYYYYYERSYLVLNRYLSEKLCRSKLRCQAVLKRQSQLLKKINYGKIYLQNREKGEAANIDITGFRYRKSISLKGSKERKLRVRPGKYIVKYYFQREKEFVEIIVKPEGTERVKIKKKKAEKKNPPRISSPRQPATGRAKTPKRDTLTKTPPPPKAVKKNPLPWIVAGIGGGSIIIGSLFLGLGYANANQLNATLQTKDRSKENLQKVNDLYNSASVQIPLGWGFFSAGSAVTLSGIIWGMVDRNRPSKSAPQPRRKAPPLQPKGNK